jgi:hypothetical protein
MVVFANMGLWGGAIQTTVKTGGRIYLFLFLASIFTTILQDEMRVRILRDFAALLLGLGNIQLCSF